MVRLRDGLSVLWRGPGEVQIGLDPRCGVVLENISEGEHRLLDVLSSAPATADLLRAGRRLGVSPDRTRRLLRTLERAGVLVPGPAPHPPNQDGPRLHAEIRAADVSYWGRARPDGDGWATLDARDAATVRVLGVDRLGMVIATGLAAAGVGRLLLEDPAPVLPQDVAPGAFTAVEIGRPRDQAGARIVRALVPDIRTSAAPHAPVDLTILVEHRVASPARSRHLVRDDLAHLSVVVGEVDVTVGPLVVPGRGPCLRCVDLHRCDADPRWPAVATQAAAAPVEGVESTLAPLGAALAVAEATSHLQGGPTLALGATLGISACDRLPVRRTWTVHPDCGCGAVAA